MAVPIEEPILEPILVEPVLTLVPDWLPGTDPDVIFPGTGNKPSWNDVYQWAKNVAGYFGRPPYVNPNVTHDELDNAVNTAIGTTIKALSGFINQAVQNTVDLSNFTQMELNALSANIGAIYQGFDNRIRALRATTNAIVQLAIPSLQAQITELRHDMNQGFAFNSAVDRAWTVDHIFAPLYESIFKLQAETQADIAAERDRANNYVDTQNHAQGIHFAELVAPAVALATQANNWIDDCGEPMCQQLGPKTDLGKLLKGLKLAGMLAIFAELATLDANELEQRLKQIAGYFGELANLFDEFFIGGETLGQLVTRSGA